MVGATLVLEPVRGVRREEVTWTLPYASVVVVDVIFEIVEVIRDDGRTTASTVVPATTTVTAKADALYPELPICGHCAAE